MTVSFNSPQSATLQALVVAAALPAAHALMDFVVDKAGPAAFKALNTIRARFDKSQRELSALDCNNLPLYRKLQSEHGMNGPVSIANAPDGKWMATWVVPPTKESAARYFGRIYNQDGSPASAEFFITDYRGPKLRSWTRLSTETAASWLQGAFGFLHTEGRAIQAYILSATTGRQRAYIQIDTNGTEGALLPQIAQASEDDKDLVVSWQDEDRQGTQRLRLYPGD